MHSRGSMAKLTKNERETLKLLIKDSSLSDTWIAERLGITKQAVGFIKKNLKKKGIIEGYSVKVSFEKLGIRVFAVVTLKVKEEGWELKEEGILKKTLQSPNIINCYRIPRGDITNILVYGFTGLEDLDNYTHLLQTTYSRYVEVHDIYIFSSKSLTKCSPESLLLKSLDEMKQAEGGGN